MKENSRLHKTIYFEQSMHPRATLQAGCRYSNESDWLSKLIDPATIFWAGVWAFLVEVLKELLKTKMQKTTMKLHYGFVDDWFIYAKDTVSRNWYQMNMESSPLWLRYSVHSNADREPNAIEKYIVPLVDWKKLSENDLLRNGWEKVDPSHWKELDAILKSRICDCTE